MSSTRSEPLIPEFYAGKSIFITGATGFMGKVLIERLLSTCPDIGRLFLLIRTKNKIEPETRLQVLKESKVFDVLRTSNPSQLDKLVLIPGDVAEPKLGISLEYMTLLHEVSLMFHSAATVKLDEELKKAVDENVRSVMRVMDICDRLPHVEAFIHVSTAYSNCERNYIEERIYPAPAPLDQLLTLVDSAPPKLFTEITTTYIAPKPNTYTFTKAIAENVIEQHGRRNYSIAIFRPSIGESQDIRVYNCSSYDNPTTWREFEIGLRKYFLANPFNDIIWYPYGIYSTENGYLEKTLSVLTQTVPMYSAEYVSRLFGIKKQISFIIADQKIQAMCKVLKFFSMNEFHFDTSNVRRLNARLSPADAKIYNLDVGTINWEEHCSDFVMGTRKYLLGEKDQDLNKARRRLRKMWYLHASLSVVSFLLFLRLLLRNQMIKTFVYGAVRLMISLVYTAYSSAVQKL